MRRLGEILMDEGRINQHQLDFCLKVQRNNGKSRIGNLLNYYQFASGADIAKALSEQSQWPLFLGPYIPNQDMIYQFGLDFFKSAHVYPLACQEGKAFVFASAENITTTDFLAGQIDGKFKCYIGIESDIKEALHQIAGIVEQTKDQQKDVLCWFESLLSHAMRHKASDIHIEPSRKAVEVRLRVNGLLRFYNSLPLEDMSKLVNVIFNKADLTVGDFFHFHDARFTQKIDERMVDVRVSHIPSVHGSSLVLRILEKDRSALALTDLGYSPQHWQMIEKALVKPEGMALIVGPTGCGKTTTLYAMLNYLKDLSKKIITIEDPVEIPLPLVTQIQIHEQRGVTFVDSIRAMLRHDPDMMLIGEIRDAQTAAQALRASMTGHKVFATLHTTRAMDAVFRLLDLGVEPVLLAQNLNMVIAQRLVRILCSACKVLKQCEKSQVSPIAAKYLSGDRVELYQARRCPQCEDGYSARSVIAEMMFIDEPMQQCLMTRDWVGMMQRVKDKDSYVAFKDDAQRLLREGKTSLEEIVRVLG